MSALSHEQAINPPRIVAIATAAPDMVLDQAEIFDTIYRPTFGNVEGAEELFCNAGPKKRHAFYHPSQSENGMALSTGQRVRLWKDGALEIGRRAAGEVIEQVGAAAIGSYIMVSSTGYDGQPPDMLLAKEFGLARTLRRTFIGHMGCHAAFNGLKTALDSLAARPDEAVLMQCTEISSVHLRASETTIEQIICQALFGDASAALVLSRQAGCQGPEVLHTHTEILYEHMERLNLSIGDDGFRMSLSPVVPFLIGNAIEGFVERLLAPFKMRPSDIAHWGIHPGGPKIIDLVATTLSLDENATHTSRSVLADYGNCASATILLILDRIMKIERPQPGAHVVLLAFGPGMTVEGALLRF